MSTANPNSNEQRTKRRQRRTDATNEAILIRDLMSRPEGRRWMWLMLESCAIFADSGDLSPQYLAWQVGRRAVGLQLLGQVTRHAPAAYIRMTEENTKVSLDLPTDEEELPDE